MKEIGLELFDAMLESEESLKKFKITKKMLAKQMPAANPVISTSSECIRVPVDPQLMFQRALNLAHASNDNDIIIDKCLSTELYRVSLSIFDKNGFMRTPIKADLAKYLITEAETLVSVDQGKDLAKN